MKWLRNRIITANYLDVFNSRRTIQRHGRKADITRIDTKCDSQFSFSWKRTQIWKIVSFFNQRTREVVNGSNLLRFFELKFAMFGALTSIRPH